MRRLRLATPIRRLTGLLLLLTFVASAADEPDPFAGIGDRVGTRMTNGIAITEGVIRVRRRHENDMDFSKYNPFYWEGRRTYFRVEDHTPLGRKRMVFSLFTEWPQDHTRYRGVDFSAIYTGDPLAHETLRSKFAINARMRHVKSFRHFEQVLDETAFHQHPDALQPGRLLTFEYRFFNDESHPGWARQKERNPHNLSAYYSEFLRIRIGEPGLHIDHPDVPEALPSTRRYAGGWTTVPTVRVEPWSALQQQAPNLLPGNSQAFLDGRTWFHTDFVTGRHLSDRSDDKPSVFFEETEQERAGYAADLYNATSCTTCHRHNGGALHPAIGEPLHTTVLRTHDPATGGPHAQFGDQLQTDGAEREGVAVVSGFATRTVRLDDGTEVTLSKPVFAIEDLEDDIEVGLSPRRPPALAGMGLLEAVPDDTLLALAKSNGGTPRRVNGRLGRFGWKAAQPDLAGQITDALIQDMGVMSAGRTALDNPRAPPGKGPLPPVAVRELEVYVALLGMPPRNRPEDPQVRAGEAVFQRLDCQRCHVPAMRTGDSIFAELRNQQIHPYTDLLLHDLGEGLADDGPAEFSRLWRTAPLWALKNTRDALDDHTGRFHPGDTDVTWRDTHAAVRENPVQLLHDGRARSLAEAILWHGGEAEESVRKYRALSRADREALDAFLWDL